MVTYEPGECNIGPAERRKRRLAGYVGFGVGVVVVAAVLLLGFDPIWLLASAAPFYGGFLGFLQARASFCAGFGLAGVYDVSEEGSDRIEVPDAAARRADRTRSLVLQLQAVALAVLLSGAIYLVGRSFA